MTMRLGTQTGSLINHVMSGARTDTPAVGMGATVLCWSDRHAGTIIEATEKSFVVQLDIATRTDKNGISNAQSYSYAPNPQGPTRTFSKVTRGKAKGAWKEKGLKDGNGVLIGHRDHHHDFSF